jgi:transcriptional regulator with XRE-family HTH domain
MALTPSICRSARALVGWTIEQLAAASEVGVSTIISFEAGQRVPMRSNQAALERAFTEAGIMFLEADMESGRGVKLTKSTEALRDILLIGALKEPLERRKERAKKRVAQFCEDSMAFYQSFYGHNRDNVERVWSDRAKLRERVDQEINLRSRLRWDDAPTRFLEPVSDLLHEST